MSTYRAPDVGDNIYDDTREPPVNKNIWSSSSSFEAVPTTSFNYLSPSRVNNAYVGSNPSIDLARLAAISIDRPTRRIDLASFSNGTKTRSTRDKQPKLKCISSRRGKLYVKLCILISVLIALAGIGLAIFASIKPCVFVKCHAKASLCIDRFPFWAQCVCDAGYAGNGKTTCVECGLSQVSPNLLRIVGGVIAVPSSWPFAVYIIQTYKGRYNLKGVNYIISNSWSCGGILINQKTVLTAAHCIHEQKFEYQDDDGEIYILQMQWNEWYSNVESTLEVYVGVNDITKLNMTSKLRIKKVNRVNEASTIEFDSGLSPDLKHEDYDEFDFKNDIATIQLHDMVERSHGIQYACLPYNYSVQYPETDKRAYIIGWGRVSEFGDSSTLLKNSIVHVFNNQQCDKVEDKINKYYDSQVCAGVLDGSTDTCQGDSGGGLFVREPALNSDANNMTVFYVAGVVSYGEGCARKNKPGIYSRTSYYVDWIRKNSDF